MAENCALHSYKRVYVANCVLDMCRGDCASVDKRPTRPIANEGVLHISRVLLSFHKALPFPEHGRRECSRSVRHRPKPMPLPKPRPNARRPKASHPGPKAKGARCPCPLSTGGRPVPRPVPLPPKRGKQPQPWPRSGCGAWSWLRRGVSHGGWRGDWRTAPRDVRTCN